MMIAIWLLILATCIFTIVAVRTKIYNTLVVKIVICLAWLLWAVYMILYASVEMQQDTFITYTDKALETFNGCYVDWWDMNNNNMCFIDYAYAVSQEIDRYRVQ